MKKLTLTLCALIYFLGHAQDIITSDDGINATVTIVGPNGHQFKITDESYHPFFPDPETPGYSYMWHTDEGHVSNEDKPIFFFESAGTHTVTLMLTPRKKGDEDLKVTKFSYIVAPSETNDASHESISEVDMYLNGEAREGDRIFVVVPLNSCRKMGDHIYRVGYDETELKLMNVLPQSNLTVIGNPIHHDLAMGMNIDRTIDFSYAWTSIRNDVAVVIEFRVKEMETTSLKFHPSKLAECDNGVEIEFKAIHGPYDPNYKESDISELNVFENPDKKIESTEVIYKVHFQNIGTAPVDSITIIDSLPNYLTFVSFESCSNPDLTVSASHIGGVLTWIIAPDADIKGTNQRPTQPEPSTKGWVSFKAKISKEEDISYSICHCLSNVATIYFDTLAPITTEADIIIIGDSLCFTPIQNTLGEFVSYADTFCESGGSGLKSISSSTLRNNENIENDEAPFVAYPNPFKEGFQLKGDLKKIQKIEILNSLGQIVLSFSNYDGSINTDNQPSGLYFIRIVTEEGHQLIHLTKN